MKRILVGGAVLALGIAGMTQAQAESGFKVTGGGQALATADSSTVRGPGDTYGFNAQDLDGNTMTDAAKGQFNTIQRDSEATVGRGRGEHIKGEVNCLVPVSAGEDGAARFGGVVRGQFDSAGDPLLFVVDVTDNGEGSRADDDDMIVFRTFSQSEIEDDENACDMEAQNDQEDTILARGNVQIHNAP